MIILFPRQIITLVLTALAVVAALFGRRLAAPSPRDPRPRVVGSFSILFTRDASSVLIPDTSGFPATITRHLPAELSSCPGAT